MNTVLVTGACINTGVAIVEKFASAGSNVIFTGRNREKIAFAEQKYREKFPEIFIKGYELSPLLEDSKVDEKSISEMFESFDKDEIYVETLVLNAADLGLGIDTFFASAEDIMRVMNTNVVWNFCLCKHAALRMKERSFGNIVFINSNTAYRTIPERVAYIASKGGQLGLMRALALELGKYNIRVNAVLPGMIKTDRWDKNPEFYENIPSRFTPIGDVATGEDIADAVFYFAKHAKNTTGAELIVDGGNSIQLYPIMNK